MLEEFKAYLFQYLMDSITTGMDEEGVYDVLHEVRTAYNLLSNFIGEKERNETQNECQKSC